MKNENYLFIFEYFVLEKEKLMLIFRFFFFLILFFFVIFSFNHKKLEKYVENDQFYYKGHNAFLTEKSINEIKSYINTCLKGELIDKKKYELLTEPKITVLMPVYNGGKKLYYSIRSIQNQKMKDIEIILINEGSKDDSSKIIQKMMEEDPRIRLINNEKNRRVLYSKSIGALYSNGKYILELDQDDMFILDNAFNILYNESEYFNLDLLQFRDIRKRNFNIYKNLKLSGSIYASESTFEKQPNLKYLMFDKYRFLIWGLLIKSEIYKKVVFHLWPFIINYKLIHYEDYIVSFYICSLAQKFKYFNNFYLIHIIYKSSSSSTTELKAEYHDSILLFIYILFEFHIKSHPEDIKVLENYIQDNNIKRIKLIKKNSPLFFKFIFKKIFDYFSIKNKKKYMKYFGLKSMNFELSSYKYIMNEEEYKSILNFQNNNLNNINYKKKIINPKFSIIIYCSEGTFINKTILSIENQENFDDYEIILIYDNKNEKVLNDINKLIKNYSNIILINNKQEKGLFFSYYEGINESKGEFILTIKEGHTLSRENVLYELNKEMKNNVEILEFNLLINNDYKINDNSLQLYRCSHFESKIKLDSFKFNQNFKEIDQEKELLINKFINSNIYKNIMKEYKNTFINNITNYYFDEIIMYIIYKKNFAIKHIDKFGVIEYSKVIQNLPDINRDYIDISQDSVSYIEFLYNNSNNTVEGKKFVLNEFYNNMNVIYNKYNEITNKGMDLMNKFLKCEYLTEYEKNNIITYYNGLIDRKKYKIIK